MSRSYRKPFATSGYGWGGKSRVKRAANKVVRQAPVVADGAGYRRLFCSYNIRDYSFYQPRPESEADDQMADAARRRAEVCRK